MGTNYYLKEGCCSKCSRAQQTLHIGKRTGGWKFTWRGYDDHSPPLLSKKDWVAFLCDSGNIIIDEYDEVLPVGAFIDMVTAWDEDPRNTRTHYAFLRAPENAHFAHRQEETWLDPEGFSFLMKDFG